MTFMYAVITGFCQRRSFRRTAWGEEIPSLEASSVAYDIDETDVNAVDWVMDETSANVPPVYIGAPPIFDAVQDFDELTIDWNNGQSQNLDLGGDVVITMINMPMGVWVHLRIAQNSLIQVVSFADDVYWGDLGPPDLSDMAHDAWIVISFYKDQWDAITGTYGGTFGPVPV